MFKEIFTESYNSDDMTDVIKLGKEVKDKYNLKKMPVRVSIDFPETDSFDTKYRNRKVRVYVDTKNNIFDFEWL